MRLVLRAGPGGPPTLDVVLGCGVIGGALCEAIARLPDSTVLTSATVPTDWTSAPRLGSSLNDDARWIETATPEAERVRLFWCAGKAGFSATEAQTATELEAFVVTLGWATSLSRRMPTEFHFTSSGGGLHEGQMLASDPGLATSRRPYALLKLAQEDALERSGLPSRFVYRPSSVYGIPRGHNRLGLLPTMVRNALRHRPTLITALPSTQRDFVAASDVAAYMARETSPFARPGTQVHYLVAGMSLSVWALQLAVERQLQRKVMVTYAARRDNFQSTSFSPAIRPKDWVTTSLECNLTRIVAAVQGRPWSP